MRHETGLDDLSPFITGQGEAGGALGLTPTEQQFIAETARESGYMPGELVAMWVRDKMADAGRARALRSEVVDRVTRLERAIAQLERATAQLDARQQTLEGQLQVFFRLASGVPLPQASASAADGAAPAAVGPASHPRPAGRSDQRPLLHEEIAAVLREAGEPLSTREIADRIRDKGRYIPPRADKPISSAMISARVSHPGYRSNFRRVGRKIELASVR